jgi:hypothetical protein
MSTNKILNIPQWLSVGSVSKPEAGYSSIFPKLDPRYEQGPTGSWYVVDSQGNEKRLAFDYIIGAGISYSEVTNPSPYGARLDIQLGGGLSYSQGFYSSAPISVWGLTPSMLSITGSYIAGYVLSTSTHSGEFQWIQSVSTINGPTNAIAKFTGDGSLTASRIIDTGVYVYIGTTPSITNASFSVDGAINVGIASDGFIYFGDQVNNYIKGENGGGMVIRTQDEFVVELFTGSVPTYKVIEFDNPLGGENRSLSLANGTIKIDTYSSSNIISATSVNLVTFGKTQSNLLFELYSATQGSFRLNDGSQGTFSVLYSDNSGLAKWGQIYGYSGLTSTGLGVGLNTVNIQGLTLSGGTFGLDYTKFGAPISVSNTFTISLATVSVTTGITYGTAFETPTFQLDQWGKIIGIGTVSTMAFTGPQGPTGFSFTWRGDYATSSTYSLYNVVYYDGSSYISTGTATPGLTPSSITASWNILAQKGEVGATGTSFVWNGSFVTLSTYTLYDVISFDGSSYISITTSNFGNTPSTATQSWNLVASKGDTGLSFNELIGGTFGDILVYGEFGWTALNPGTAGYVLTSGGTQSLPYWTPQTGSAALFGTFSRNFTPVLTGTKTFGKYPNGIEIASIGLTLEEFILDVVTETLPPDVQLTIVQPPSIPFGATSASFDLDYSYTITNAGADVASALLEFSDDNQITWLTLDTGTATPNSLGYTVSFPEYTTDTYYFRYTVTDTKNGVGQVTRSRSVDEYVSPDVQTTIQAQTKIGAWGETDYVRRLGNVESEITLIYERLSESIDCLTFSLFYKFNNQGFELTPLYTDSLPNPNNDSISRDHDFDTPVSNIQLTEAISLSYRHTVRDEFSTKTSNQMTVMFYPLIYFGPTVSNATNKAELETLPIKTLLTNTSGNFQFSAGTTYKKWVIALPAERTITAVQEVSTPNITNRVFTQPSSFTVGDFDDQNFYNYKIWVVDSGTPYSLNADGSTPILRVTYN